LLYDLEMRTSPRKPAAARTHRIDRVEDIKLRPDWERRNVELFHHQSEHLCKFCKLLPVRLLADDVGLGKTISAGLILGEPVRKP